MWHSFNQMGRVAYSSEILANLDPDSLNPSQREFLRVYLETGKAVDAYLQAYPDASYPSAESAAYRLLDNVRVVNALKAAVKKEDPNCESTIVEKFQLAAQMAEMQQKPDSLVNAAVWMGKRIGMFKEADRDITINVLHLSVAAQPAAAIAANLSKLSEVIDVELPSPVGVNRTSSKPSSESPSPLTPPHAQKS